MGHAGGTCLTVKFCSLIFLWKQFIHPCKSQVAAVSFLYSKIMLSEYNYRIYNQGQLLIFPISNGLEIIKTWKSFVNLFNTSPRQQTFWPLYHHSPQSISNRKAASHGIKSIHISELTKWRPPLWTGPRHKSKPKSSCIYRKQLSRKPDIHHHNPPTQL